MQRKAEVRRWDGGEEDEGIKRLMKSTTEMN